MMSFPLKSGLALLLLMTFPTVKGHDSGYQDVIMSDTQPSVQNERIHSEESIPKEREEDIYSHPEWRPHFPGGSEALYKWIKKNLRYPKSAKKKDIEGKVPVTIVIEKDGTISHFVIFGGADKSLKKEARRLLKKMPAWLPAYHENKPVRSQTGFMIKFQLEEKD